MTLLSVTVTMWIVIDPVGNIGLFMAALGPVRPERRRRVLVRELLIALVVLIAFLFVGQYALNMLSVSQTALSIAGGVILLLIALRMIFPPERPLGEHVDGEPLVVPLAIPYFAGPSALATELLLMSKEPDRWPEWLAAVTLAWFASSLILYFASGLQRYLTDRGIVALERLMGMVLVAVAVQMMIAGFGEFLRSTH
jgi:multiple antibiotic resistance protein